MLTVERQAELLEILKRENLRRLRRRGISSGCTAVR